MSLKLWHQSTTEMTRDSPYGLPAGTYRGRGVSAANIASSAR